MKISEKLNSGKINISLEVFPPKTSDTYDKVQDAVDKIGALKPAFISVTYGAGGGTSKNTLKIAKHIKDDLGVDSRKAEAYREMIPSNMHRNWYRRSKSMEISVSEEHAIRKDT